MAARRNLKWTLVAAGTALSLAWLCCCAHAAGPPRQPLGQDGHRNATKRRVGSVVPQPQKIDYTNGVDYLEVNPSSLEFVVGAEVRECEMAQLAVKRYKDNLLFDDMRPEAKDDPFDGKRKRLGQLKQVQIAGPNPNEAFLCELIPREDMDETYTLSVTVGDPSVASLRAKTTWGIMRGLETLSQLIFNIRGNGRADEQLFAIQPVQVDDWPRFSHRGYMLDTARHYISLEKIIELLDAMAYNKLNVFHWHIIDDQSFPWESYVYPQLSKKNAFRPNLIYTRQDVKFVVLYAASRGIRVVAELDTPGHSYALRDIPNLLSECYDVNSEKPNGDFGPIDPTKSNAYKSVDKLLGEINEIFFDNYFHAGGDEVEFDCWASNPEINRWMSARNMSGNYEELSNYYIRRLYNMVKAKKMTMLVWQEVFDMGANLPKDTIIHVWKDINDKPNYTKELAKVVKNGYRALLSSCWYLNYIDYGLDWIKFYECDPVAPTMTDEEEKRVLGGEICMWTEYVDDANVVPRTWPRASAAAERLWSSNKVNNVNEFTGRLEQLRCRLFARGIQAEPVIGPGYC